MMISTKLSLQSLTLVLVVFTIFSVSLTENLQLADGLSATGSRITENLDIGENTSVKWKIINNSDEKIWVEMYSTGDGSELLHFDKLVTLEPRKVQEVEIIIAVPDDHPDNIELRPKMFALQRGDPLAEGVTGAVVNVQLKKTVTILIGDNPIYTPPQEEEIIVKPPPIIIPEKEAAKAKTLEDKLAEIAANNAALEAQQEVQVDDTFEESFEEEAVPELQVDDNYIPEPVMDTEPVSQEGGGCLIATATFGSELAPQVQLLREIRDNQLMGTGSGMAFMAGFNSLYYSFSPTIADMERDNPAFKELVKLTITPMISTLSVMENAESESEVLGLGIGVILMNLGMYVGLPTFGIVKLIQFRKN